VTLQELYNLLSLIVCFPVAFGLLYAAATVDWYAPIEPRKIAAWWRSRTTSVTARVTPRKHVPRPSQYHKDFDHPV
jgi:hypothetical protein